MNLSLHCSITNLIIIMYCKINLTSKTQILEVKTCDAGTSAVQILIGKLQISIVKPLRFLWNHYSMKFCAILRLFIQAGNKHIIHKQFQAAEFFLFLKREKKKSIISSNGFHFWKGIGLKRISVANTKKTPWSSSLKDKQTNKQN